MTLVLKRASASRPSGEWNDDDFDVLAPRATPRESQGRGPGAAASRHVGPRAARPGGWLAVIGRAASPSEKTARVNIVP